VPESGINIDAVPGPRTGHLQEFVAPPVRRYAKGRLTGTLRSSNADGEQAHIVFGDRRVEAVE
jgi:hypothetical protein